MSKIAISSIAWSNEEEAEVANNLAKNGLKYVELAPTKIWQDPTKATDQEIKSVLDFWENHGIKVVAFQSMLFGRENLKIFSDEKTRQMTLDFLKEFIVLANKMGVSVMVFGSPKNRQKDTMSLKEANQIAVDFFRELGKTAKENNVYFCIEPNPTDYACDFITNSKQGVDFVREVNSDGIGLHLDIAGMTLAGDDIYQSIIDNSDVLKHFHISSPFLGDVNDSSEVNHADAVRGLKDIDYKGYVSIEMRPSSDVSNVQRALDAFKFAKKTY